MGRAVAALGMAVLMKVFGFLFCTPDALLLT